MSPTELEDKRAELRQVAEVLVEGFASATRAGDRRFAMALAYAAQEIAQLAECPALPVIYDDPLEELAH